KGRLQAVALDFLKKCVRIGKQQLIPRVSRPAQCMAGLVLLTRKPGLMKRQVPGHVDNQHVEGNIIFAEAANEVLEFLIAVSPIARPPCAKSETRRQRNASGNPGEVSERLLVIVPVAKEIPVLTLACRALHHPGPRTLLTLQKAEIVGIEERTRGVVHQGPAIT